MKGKLLLQSLEWLFQILSKSTYSEDLSDVNFSRFCIKREPRVNVTDQKCRPPRLTDDKKCPKVVPQKKKFGPKYKLFKILIFGIIFLKILFRA